MSTSPAMFSTALNGKGLTIGIVVSRFNGEICTGLLQACQAELQVLGVEDVTVIQVPGALEIALVLQRMAKSGKFDALIALGAIIRGETYHFELVANESGAAVTRVGLDFGIPIANTILTTENEAQALARVDEKGRDAARVAVELAGLLPTLDR